jgi:ribosomal protein S19
VRSPSRGGPTSTTWFMLQRSHLRGVRLPRRRSRPATRHVHGRARRAFHCSYQQKSPTETGKEANGSDQEAEEKRKREPSLMKSHLRRTTMVPENDQEHHGLLQWKTCNQVGIKPEMIDHYLAEFSISYKSAQSTTTAIFCSCCLLFDKTTPDMYLLFITTKSLKCA